MGILYQNQNRLFASISDIVLSLDLEYRKESELIVNRKILFPAIVWGLLSLGMMACALPFGNGAEQETTEDQETSSSTDDADDDSDTSEAPAPSNSEPVVIPATPTPIPADLIAEADAEELLLINLYERVNPSVVSISISQEFEEDGLFDVGNGSGFIYSEDGHIVTNNHVVAEADAVRVTFYDGTVLNAEVVGTDVFSDLAVIQVVDSDYPFSPVTLGNSDEVLVGQRAIAIGNPFALSNTMTVGIVSAVGRTLPADQSFSNPLIIQTDAPINPGNSGGPLLNSQGEVIGVNTAIRSETGANTGIGFAVPVNTVSRIVPQLIETGEVKYPYLGIQALGGGITLYDLSLEFDIPVQEGVLITNVLPDTAAEEAGLQGGNESVNFRALQSAWVEILLLPLMVCRSGISMS